MELQNNMSNQYETLRETVTQVVKDTAIKIANDGTATAYNWSVGKVFAESEMKFAEYLLNGKLPPMLKDIIRFEFNKLKETVMSNENWQALRTRETYVLTPDSVEKRRTDTFGLKAISLEEQLLGATGLLDKVGKALAKSGNEETTIRLNKRQRRIVKEIDFIRQEMARQNALKTVEVKQETVTV